MRYFLELSYDGQPFHGWQRQPNASSVQEVLENSISTIIRQDITLTGAGRTDTGVHARQMYAHFDSEIEIKDKEVFIRSLNRMIGKSIAIKRLILVDDNAHSRFDAIERSYKYFIIYEKNPFLRNTAWFSPCALDVHKMNEAAMLLIDTKDFTSFAKLHSDTKTNFCDVRKAEWQIYENIYGTPGIVFNITADRFLRNMVRAIVGTLVEVGREKITIPQFKDIIRSADRGSAGMSMPAEGLFLWEVKYSYIN
ncbi:MAG: tRNA pseudouridine(38-40) synthase TruA [Muribaculaceae bacterium]|nr:tRNA pseudouridine(38-40) synthase TruA [Muribaculaceae bacterium]